MIALKAPACMAADQRAHAASQILGVGATEVVLTVPELLPVALLAA